MKKILGFLLVLAALGLASCGMGEKATGVLTVRVGSDMSKDVVMPDDSLVAALYEITVTGVDGPGEGTVVEDTLTAAGQLSFDIMPGIYDVTVNVRNALEKLIGSGGQAGVPVTIGTPKNIAILCVPLDGSGDLFAEITWEPDVVANPVIELALRSFTNRESSTSDVMVAMTPGTGEIATGSTTQPAGWYLGLLRILDGTVLNTGIVRAVRLAANCDTHWTEHVFVNSIQGELVLDIGYNPGPPLVLEGTAPGSYVAYRGNPTTFEITGADQDDETSLLYGWYVDGQAVALGSAASFTTTAMAYNAGTFHYLSALVFQSDGCRLGEAQYTMEVEEPTPEMCQIRLSAPNYYQFAESWTAFEIRKMSDWTQVVATSEQTLAHNVSWTSPVLPVGTYYVVQVINEEAWNASLGRYLGIENPLQNYGPPTGGIATIITLPNDPATVYSWTTQPIWY